MSIYGYGHWFDLWRHERATIAGTGSLLADTILADACREQRRRAESKRARAVADQILAQVRPRITLPGCP